MAGRYAHNKLPPGEAALNELFASYRSRAKTKGVPFELERGQFRKLTRLPCHYCGQEPKSLWRSSRSLDGYVYNGVDRIQSDGGYVEDNVITACGTCNHMKSDRQIVEFLNHVRRIARHMPGG